MSQSKVTVIVPTKNSAGTLGACLESIKKQTYQVELIVVDNKSDDDTLEIAKKYTEHAFTKGPERSTQRNFGVDKSTGDWVVIIDSDMELSPKVIEQCVNKVKQDEDIVGVIIPEESFGRGFWAQCKKLERSFYIGVDWMEAARFYNKNTYQELGGFDTNLVSGEDWDLSQRFKRQGKISRIKALIYHNEGQISLLKTIQKKYYYAGLISRYFAKNKNTEELQSQTGVFARYWLFLRQPVKLFRNPILGLGMLFMKTVEFGAGAVGILASKLKPMKS